MDAISLLIIFIATVLALVFKFVIYKKIQGWVDQDLLKSLAKGNPEKLNFLKLQYQQLLAAKVKRKEAYEKLQILAEKFEHTQ